MNILYNADQYVHLLESNIIEYNRIYVLFKF